MPRYWFIAFFYLLAATDTHAAELTPVDLVPKSDWRYFYNSNFEVVDDESLHQALEAEGFYTVWTSQDFPELPIASIEWQTGELPIGYNANDAGTLLPPRMTRFPTFFLRKTFTIPDGVSGPFGLELVGIDGFAVHLDGVELTRENCCVDVNDRT